MLELLAENLVEPLRGVIAVGGVVPEERGEVDVPAQSSLHGRDGGRASDSGEIRATRRAQRRERPALDARGRGPRAGGEGLERIARVA